MLDLAKAAGRWERGFRKASTHYGSDEKLAPKFFENLSCLREILPNLAPGNLFMLGRLAVTKIIYVRPVGGPPKHFKYWGKS